MYTVAAHAIWQLLERRSAEYDEKASAGRAGTPEKNSLSAELTEKFENLKTEIFLLTNVLEISIITFAVDEAWLSLVERCVRDAEVVGSNPVASTKKPSVYAGFQTCVIKK